MVSLTLGLVLLAGVTTVFSTSVRGNADAVRISHVTQDLRAIMDVTTRELRRAGYWGNAAAGGNNPFSAIAVNGGGNCILYSWDENNNGNVDNNERRGFRLNGGTVEWRKSNAGGAPNCNAPNGWTAISDPAAVNVTGLNFVLSNLCTNVSTTPRSNCTVGAPDYQAPGGGDITVIVSQVGVTLTASAVQDAQVAMTLTENVRVRNER